MRTIFIADAHLQTPDTDNYRQLLRFLNELAGQLDTLYIMGDLFDFWIGFPSYSYPHYQDVLTALEQIVSRGGKIVYFEGNHDFHLGTIFSGKLKAMIHTSPASTIIQGKKLYLCHGDQINKADRSYRLLRSVLRSRPVTLSVKFFPPALALGIRASLQSRSRAGYKSKMARWDYRKIIMDFAGALQQQGYDGLVTGHFHLAMCEGLPGTGFSILSLGDWMGQLTYGEMHNGEFLLKHYTANHTTS